MALAASLALAACGGGGGGGGSNRAPTASFTVTPSSGTAPLTVTLNGSASADPDGTISSFSWNFGDNSSGSGVSTTHTYTVGGSYTITLKVTDNKGKTGTGSQAITVSPGPPPTSVVVSGRITYDRVPFKTLPMRGLDYALTFEAPARNVVVELIKSVDQSVLFTVSTDSNGNYSFPTAPASTDVKVRVKAQTRSTVGPKWNLQVKDNTNSNALYVMDSASFNTGAVNTTKNLVADSGAAGFSSGGSIVYTQPRVAAPFAILDSLYSAVQFVVTQGDDNQIVLPDLDVFWSPLNQACDNCDFVPSSGNIQTTQYRSDPATGGIYVLGKENVDTDEYDEHVLTHEFQHYLQDVTSRDDTVGGAHSLGEKLDARVAFSEGYANAFSGMSLGDPVYRDSMGSRQGDDSNFNLETDAFGTSGWFNESTIGRVAWDLYDSAADTNDLVSIPYASIATVFRNQLRTGPPLTSVFPFGAGLKALPSAPVSAINSLLSANGIKAADGYGSTETVDGGNSDGLPVYQSLALNGGAVTVCGNRNEGLFNKLANRRFLKFTLNATVNATIRAMYTSTGSDAPVGTTVTPDPDIVLYKSAWFATSESDAANQEELVRTLDAGDYVIEVYEYSHIEAPASPETSRGRTCYNVTITG
jgi:PKD repeat protein